MPDVCVLRAAQVRNPIVIEAPLLCVESLPRRPLRSHSQKCDEYLQIGVVEAWIFDAEERLVFVLHRDGTLTTHSTGTLTVEGTAIEVPVAEIFAVLDAG